MLYANRCTSCVPLAPYVPGTSGVRECIPAIVFSTFSQAKTGPVLPSVTTPPWLSYLALLPMLTLVSSASSFDFKFNVATIDDFHNSGSFRVVTGGTGCDDYTVDLSGLVTVPSTGGWGTFTSLPV